MFKSITIAVARNTGLPRVPADFRAVIFMSVSVCRDCFVFARGSRLGGDPVATAPGTVAAELAPLRAAMGAASAGLREANAQSPTHQITNSPNHQMTLFFLAFGHFHGLKDRPGLVYGFDVFGFGDRICHDAGAGLNVSPAILRHHRANRDA